MNKGVETELRSQTAWLHRLAVALVGDAGAAEDLVQDVWMAALQARPRFEDSGRRWLATVARNFVRSRARSARSHDRWLRLVSDGDPQASPEALTIRQEDLQRLGELVAALDEPFRSTLMCCYGEELAPSEVARRLGVPAGTVRWRLKEALDRLRAAVGESSDRAALAASAAARGDRARRLVIKVALVPAAAALVVLAVVALWPAPAPTRRAAHSRTSSQIPAWVAQPGVARSRVAGRVLDGGALVAGARVVLGHQLARYGALPPAETVSDSEGRFDFGPQLATTYTVMASAPGRAIAAAKIDLRDPQGARRHAIELRLGPCIDGLQGRIMGPAGPIAGAQVLASGLLGVTTDRDGWYDLCVGRGRLDTSIEASGYGVIMIKADVVGRLRRDVTLVPAGAISGQVVEERGAPVARAHVRAWRSDLGTREHFVGPRSALTGADGRFELGGLEPGRWLFTADAGGLAAGPLVERVLAAGWSDGIALPVRPALEVSGRVLDHGVPVAGATIKLLSRGGEESSDTARTQEDGSFAIDRVEPGLYRVFVHGFVAVAPREIAARAGSERELDIAVESVRGASRANDRATDRVLSPVLPH
jgi:RNA polymerase sigma factor (sigma-70 family)